MESSQKNGIKVNGFGTGTGDNYFLNIRASQIFMEQ